MRDATLTPSKQEAYTLFQLENKSLQETASIKKISVGTVLGKFFYFYL
jgi:DNA-directed RNA polymerase specialized sigma24 family protein